MSFWKNLFGRKNTAAVATPAAGRSPDPIDQLTDEAYRSQSQSLEQAVADLIDKDGTRDNYLRDLARLVRLNLDERRQVQRERAANSNLKLSSVTRIIAPTKMRQPLPSQMEVFANRLATLIPDDGRSAYAESVFGEVRYIGECLYQLGGLQGMGDVWMRLDALGGHSGVLSVMWHRVHTWRDLSTESRTEPTLQIIPANQTESQSPIEVVPGKTQQGNIPETPPASATPNEPNA